MIDPKKIKTSDYLKYFPTPFLEDLVRGKVIPFIGAGFSRNADFPKGKEMPDWNRLGELIASDLSTDYEYANPVEAISTYEQEFSRARLVEKFNELLLTGIIKPGKAHASFSKIPFELVCTTNFDFLLENAYEQSNIYCRPIIDEEHLAINNPDSKNVSLLKIHGDLHHPNRLVATEEDYDGFLNRHPMLATFLANLLITKTCLFIGYSLDDPDFRQIWQLIKDRLGKLRRPAFVINVGASKQGLLKFERRGVKVINIPKDSKKTYAEIFERVFDELREFWSKELPVFATVTDENTKIQLSLNSDSYSRLCYFSVPLKYLSIYKKYIFPIVQNYNFVPVTVDEFIQSGDNILATISSLIDKATMIIADISSDSTRNELGMILSKSKEKKVVIISDKPTQQTFYAGTYSYALLIRPENFLEDADEFALIFENNFSQIASSIQENIDSESRRLLNKHEYGAAIISAVTLFEDVLRARLDKDIEKSNNLYSLTKLLDLAYKQNLIDQRQIRELKEWLIIRNKLVHTTTRQITRQLATRIIDSIEQTIIKIRG
jgi:hypothetical protein